MMNYRQRLRLAVIFAVLLHLMIILPVWGFVRPPGAGPDPEMEPLVLRLRMDARPQRLVDTAAPAEEAPEDTDLISDQNSRAADESMRQGEKAGPAFDSADTFDELPAPEVSPEERAAPRENMPSPEKDAAPAETAPVAPPEAPAPGAIPVQPPLPEGETAEQHEAAAERFELARRNDAAPLPDQAREGRAREYDSVSREGMTNFDAIESDIAPYLKEIRRRVERGWNEVLLTRYTGTRPVRAVIDCAISPDGKLVRAEAADVHGDRVFAALCRMAVEKAAPFGPFPFDVPDMYRGKNLEIRWTFSFLHRP
jgi:outer membrane biosynthesis protein TonB